MIASNVSSCRTSNEIWTESSSVIKGNGINKGVSFSNHEPARDMLHLSWTCTHPTCKPPLAYLAHESSNHVDQTPAKALCKRLTVTCETQGWYIPSHHRSTQLRWDLYSCSLNLQHMFILASRDYKYSVTTKQQMWPKCPQSLSYRHICHRSSLLLPLTQRHVQLLV